MTQLDDSNDSSSGISVHRSSISVARFDHGLTEEATIACDREDVEGTLAGMLTAELQVHAQLHRLHTSSDAFNFLKANFLNKYRF